LLIVLILWYIGRYLFDLNVHSYHPSPHSTNEFSIHKSWFCFKKILCTSTYKFLFLFLFQYTHLIPLYPLPTSIVSIIIILSHTFGMLLRIFFLDSAVFTFPLPPLFRKSIGNMIFTCKDDVLKWKKINGTILFAKYSTQRFNHHSGLFQLLHFRKSIGWVVLTNPLNLR